MNLPKGVTEAQWVAALAFIDAWKPGQRCEGIPRQHPLTGEWRCHKCDSRYSQFDQGLHDIPIPVATDELLMRMWRALFKWASYVNCSWEGDRQFEIQAGDGLGELIVGGENEDAAIILAAAAEKPR